MVAGAALLVASASDGGKTPTALLDARGSNSNAAASGDVISVGTPVKEAATGILFPQLCNGYSLAGTGVRVKWGLIKVYAVGTYLDPLAVSALTTASNEAIEQALLDPNNPRTIRIVMNRALSIEKYTDAIVEALKPRMKGQDLDKLEEFKALNAPIDLINGAFLCVCVCVCNTSVAGSFAFVVFRGVGWIPYAVPHIYALSNVLIHTCIYYRRRN